jgi:uncharacterized membrane protein
MIQEVVYASIIISGIIGFSIAYYIYSYKRNKTKSLVCPLNFHCDPVINSKYSKIFGFPVEVLGLMYYAIISVAYIFFWLSPFSVNFWFTQSVVWASAAAFIFSIYLTYIQAFTLKNWCSWCLVSAALCVVILVLAFFV